MPTEDPMMVARYIVDFFGHLLTDRERGALHYDRVAFKVQNARRGGSHRLADLMERRWMTHDPETIALLDHGADALYLQIAERVLRETPEEVAFNRCPRCGGLARTPRARQCRHCYFDWHDSTEST